MKTFSRILALTGSIALLVSSSCSSEPVVTQQNKQVQINLSWWGTDARNKYTIQAVELFEEKYPNIKVNCSYSEWSGYEERSKIQMRSNTEADVMQINFSWLSQYSEDGEGYYDINELDNFNLSNFSEDFLEYGIKNDRLNAIPIAMNAETVYINQDVYDRYGLDTPQTWDDLFKSAEVMKKDGIYPMSGASKSIWLYLIAHTEQVTGKKIIENNKLNFKAEDFQNMIEFYNELVDKCVIPQLEYYDSKEIAKETYAGSIAWVSDATNYFGSMIEDGINIITADYTTLDGNNIGEGWYAKPATMYAVSKNTVHPEEAGLLLDFLMNSSEVAELQGVEKGIPLSRTAKKTLEKNYQLYGIQYEASQKMDDCQLGELSPVLENNDLIDDFFSACNDVLYEKSTPEDSAKALYIKTAEYF
ncbi:MAG: ABC transporter substrate-binding protein [Ruminococcus flavefaciens]|nr:ABC transporter substrate-binding protein [Ruminococcus flavefaciens]